MADRQIALRKFFIKLFHWEYWPFGIIQFPVIIYYFWLSLRARTFLFFSASNPGIDMGGMFGESKYDVLKKIPSQYIPRTVKIKLPASAASIQKILKAEQMDFPLIFKPDIGERGFRVQKINSLAQAERYAESAPYDFMIQELVDLPVEMGVFYERLPAHSHGVVTSIVLKEMLFVVGDGKSTLQQLILANDRALLQWEKLKLKYSDELYTVLPDGSRKELVSIGNHALGTKFMNGNYLINDRLHRVFDSISKQIDGFYFGRFDLRCKSIEDLYNGNLTVLELNGCGAEPAHIYDPTFKLLDAVTVLLRHWKMIFLIARQNHAKGIQYIRYSEAKNFYRKFKRAMR